MEGFKMQTRNRKNARALLHSSSSLVLLTLQAQAPNQVALGGRRIQSKDKTTPAELTADGVETEGQQHLQPAEHTPAEETGGQAKNAVNGSDANSEQTSTVGACIDWVNTKSNQFFEKIGMKKHKFQILETLFEMAVAIAGIVQHQESSTGIFNLQSLGFCLLPVILLVGRQALYYRGINKKNGQEWDYKKKLTVRLTLLAPLYAIVKWALGGITDTWQLQVHQLFSVVIFIQMYLAQSEKYKKQTENGNQDFCTRKNLTLKNVLLNLAFVTAVFAWTNQTANACQIQKAPVIICILIGLAQFNFGGNLEKFFQKNCKCSCVEQITNPIQKIQETFGCSNPQQTTSDDTQSDGHMNANNELQADKVQQEPGQLYGQVGSVEQQGQDAVDDNKNKKLSIVDNEFEREFPDIEHQENSRENSLIIRESVTPGNIL